MSKPESQPPATIESTPRAIARFGDTKGTVANSIPLVQDDGRISTVTDPTSGQDVATKAYVDAAIKAAIDALPDEEEPPIEPEEPPPEIEEPPPDIEEPPIEPEEPPPAGGRAPFKPADLFFKGQQNVDLNYSNLAMAIREVDNERRLLFYQFDGWQPNAIGDLIEYRESPAGLKNGEAHWTQATVPNLVEIRRWKGWNSRQKMLDGGYPGTENCFGGNGVWASSFYWHEPTKRLFYTWQPVYPGGAMIWPIYSAVELRDEDATPAGGEARQVDPSCILGPWYFRDPTMHDDFKQAACGFIPIPESRQADMGGKYLIPGHHCANIGSKGPRGMSLWVIDDLPTELPPEGTALWPGEKATLIFDTSPETGAQPYPHLKIPNVQYPGCGHASQGTQFAFSAGGGTPTAVQAPCASGVAVNDAFYQHDYGGIDCVSVRMETPAQGGKFVPELWDGTNWAEAPGWQIAAGAEDLSAAVNVFWWPQQWFPDVDPDGPGPIEQGTYIRLRRVTPGVTDGVIKALITTTGLITGDENADRPTGEGGTAPLGEEQFDQAHYAYAYEESFWGGAWVETGNVEGLVYFGPLRTGAQWYGAAPAWMQPVGGGPPSEKTFFAAEESFANGGKSEGPFYPFMFHFTVERLIQLVKGELPRNADGCQPEAYSRLAEMFPELIFPGRAANPQSPYHNEPTFNVYGTGHSVCLDTKRQEILLWMSNASVWSGQPILGVFGVR